MANSRSTGYPGEYRVAKPRKAENGPELPLAEEEEVEEEKYEIAKSRAKALSRNVGSGFGDFGSAVGWFTRPRNHSRNGSHVITPSDRFIFLLAAFVTTGWSAFLNYLAMLNFVPAFRLRAGQPVSMGAVAATVVLSIILFAVEFVIWKGNHSPVEWCVFGIIFAFDIWVNLAGTMNLLAVPRLYWPWEFTPLGDRPDMASCICLVVAVPSAILPEWLWRRARD
ncbi:MAG TPA: hypothetical protein VH186_33885 [Chloroflexia bacterium]|nr:hypothetical protein [Chloroflexia bacterium]